MHFDKTILKDTEVFINLNEKLSDLLQKNQLLIELGYCDYDDEYQKTHIQAINLKQQIIKKCHNDQTLISLYGELYDMIQIEEYLRCSELQAKITNHISTFVEDGVMELVM